MDKFFGLFCRLESIEIDYEHHWLNYIGRHKIRHLRHIRVLTLLIISIGANYCEVSAEYTTNIGRIR